MADALSKFISGLQTLDANNLGAPQNAAALQKFQGLSSDDQRGVLNGLAGKYGSSFDELNGLSDGDKRKVMDNVKNGRGTFDGIRPQQQPAQSFESAWSDAAAKARTQPSPPAPAKRTEPTNSMSERWQRAAAKARATAEKSTDAVFAERHGAEALRQRHGYIPREREAQLNRIASIQAEAKATNKSFSEVADARVAVGK
jgi:hypothetical protein